MASWKYILWWLEKYTLCFPLLADCPWAAPALEETARGREKTQAFPAGQGWPARPFWLAGSLAQGRSVLHQVGTASKGRQHHRPTPGDPGQGDGLPRAARAASVLLIGLQGMEGGVEEPGALGGNPGQPVVGRQLDLQAGGPDGRAVQGSRRRGLHPRRGARAGPGSWSTYSPPSFSNLQYNAQTELSACHVMQQYS